MLWTAKKAPRFFRRALAGCAGLVLLAAAAHAGFYYKVQPGDTMDSIAWRFRVTAYDIAKANNLSVNSEVKPGAQIWLPTSAKPKPRETGSTRRTVASPPPRRETPRESKPVKVASARATSSRYTVRAGDSLWGVARKHDVSVDDLARANGLSNKAQLEIGQKLVIPSKSGATAAPAPRRELARPSTSAPSRPAASTSAVSSRGFSWPARGELIGRFENSASNKHAGIDIALPVGSAVRAARDGEVIYAGDSIPAYGNMVIVRHSGGIATCYAYNSRLDVRVGDRVRRGEVIARSGDSGPGDRPHLHFQLRRNRTATNPLPYLP